MRKMFVCRFFRSRRQQRGVKATRVILIVDQREGCRKQRTDLRPVCPHNCRPCYAMLFGQHLRLPLSNVYHDVTVNNVKEKCVCSSAEERGDAAATLNTSAPTAIHVHTPCDLCKSSQGLLPHLFTHHQSDG